MNLNNFFHPKSVAVIGASADKNKVGYAIMSNLILSKNKMINSGLTLEIFPVNISESEILGLKAFKSVKDIPIVADLALIVVRADIVPNILAECGEKGIKNVIIISAGFKETGVAGKELEDKCGKIANDSGIALLGPNCLGTIDLKADFNCSFSAQTPKKGDIAFLSQSGALGTSMLDLAIQEGVGFSKFISLGNEAQLTEMDFLEYLAKDDDTKFILIYLEKLSNGRRFIELATEIVKTKPIVVIKAGRSKRGQRAVASHTGSLAPEDAVFSSACKQAGVIVVESIREFLNVAKIFQLGIHKPIKNIVILTNGGGPSVVATDLIDLSKSLSLVEFSPETKDALRKVLPSMASVENPVDIIGDALSNRYEEALKILCIEKNTDAIILILTPQMMTEVHATAELIIKYRNEKTIIPVFMGGPMVDPARECLKQNNIVNFTFAKDAVEVLDNLSIMESETDKSDSNIEAKGRHLPSSSLKMMEHSMMLKLMKEYNLSMPGILLHDKSQIAQAISKMGKGLFSMKVISPDIVHKSDAGVVALNIKSVEEARIAFDSIIEKGKRYNPNAKIEGVVIQTMATGKEVIIGMKKDNDFGPTILFGLGGIFTEILKDVSMRIAPIDRNIAKQMLAEIRGRDIIFGARGEKSVDIEGLIDVLVNVSKLSMEHPEIIEIDMNPVMATSEVVHIVDARMMV